MGWIKRLFDGAFLEKSVQMEKIDFEMIEDWVKEKKKRS